MTTCMFCPETFWNDLDYNAHLLFIHGKCRSMCSTNVDAKRLQVAELMRHDFDSAKSRGELLDCFYILYKMNELGIQNVRHLWEFSGKTYKKMCFGELKSIREKQIIPIEKIEKTLVDKLYMNSNRARKYDARYEFINQKTVSPFEGF